MKTVAICQSSYLPWKGYFDLINFADEFILLDSVQYTRRDWRNRNQIKTSTGPRWITIPIESKGRRLQRISDAVIADPSWAGKHWEMIRQSYGRARYFADYKGMFERLYRESVDDSLSAVNYRFLVAICQILRSDTVISRDTDYQLTEGKTARLVYLCRQAGATEYLSGPSAADYIQPDLFAEAGIRLRYMDYSGYPEHRQLYPPFVHQVSILDLLFNEGPNATQFMKSFAR